MSTAEMKEFRDEVLRTLKTYLQIMIFMFGILASVIGWNTVERLRLTRDYESLRSDFGIILMTSPSDHRQSMMFDEITKKYFPNVKRGSDTK
jgi:hypothetical protein